MFKSYRSFTIDKPFNRKNLKVIHTIIGKGYLKQPYTIVQLHQTEVVKRQNINNIVSLNSGGWRTYSTKTVMNTALRLIYGDNAPQVFQKKGEWYIQLDQKNIVPYHDGIKIGGGTNVNFITI